MLFTIMLRQFQYHFFNLSAKEIMLFTSPSQSLARNIVEELFTS